MFRRLPLIAATALCAIAAPAFAQSPFDGTWKADLTAASVDARPNEILLKDGTYTCSTCLPSAYSVKADGAFHPVRDRPYWDEIAVRVVDASTISYQYRKDGKVVARTVQAVAPEGNLLAVKSQNSNNGAGAEIESTATLTRVGPAPTGAHAVSGAWKAAPAASASDAALVFEIKVDGDKLHFATPKLGESLDTTFGGDFTLNANDPGRTMTKAERLAPNVIRLTDMQAGKVTQVSTYTVSDDGKTIAGEWQDPRDGAKGRVLARRQ